MNEIKEYTKVVFDDIKHIDENGIEYWYARELFKVLGYKEYRKFIEKQGGTMPEKLPKPKKVKRIRKGKKNIINLQK